MTTTTSHGDLPESFSPETVDDEITRYLSTEPQPVESAGDTLLIRELAAYHALPPEASASLARAHARLRTIAQSLGGSGESRRRGATTLHTQAERNGGPQMSQPWPDQPQQSAPRRRHHLTALATPLRAVAAVLVVALLVGGFVAVLHLRAGRQTGAAPTWQNVAITQANAQGHPLEFDPARVEVEYAVSDVDGTIYAHSDIHLWYSVDGGATYRPFPLSLPTVKGWSYAISTVPGLRGVFVSSGAQPFATIYYAELGGSSWRALNTSDVAQPLAPNGTTVAFDASAIGNAIFYKHESGKSVQARAVGDWLFVLAKQSDGSNSTLIGTPDFGTTWYALSATLSGSCTQFAVNPADARQIFCLMDTHTAQQSADGGLTWQQMASAPGSATGLYQAIWASQHAVYSYYTTLGTDKLTLAKHKIGAGDWSAAATLPTLPQGGGSEVIGVSPDDTVYAAAALPGSPMRVRISALAPGAQQFTQIGNDATLTLPTSAIFFDLGGIYSGKTPAVYVHVAPWDVQTSPRPLYRLALQATDTAPFETPTTLPTITLTLHAACTSAPGDIANIQSGGYGANIDTFPQRWGTSNGVALGSVYFGRWPDGSAKVQVADAMPSNHRVYAMSYLVSKSQNVTQAQGETLATTIVPKDAVQVARTQQGNNITVTYCSAALIAAFPASVRDINGPLPHNGLVTVTYTYRSDGYLFGIGFGPLP